MRDTLIMLAVFTVGWVVMWLLLTFLISRLSGWSALAERYRVDSVPTDIRGRRIGRATMRLNTRYTGVITLRPTARGLYMSVLKIFPNHPPLLVPWEQIEMTSERGLFFPYMRFRFTAAPGVYLRIDYKLASEILTQSPGQSGTPPSPPARP